MLVCSRDYSKIIMQKTDIVINEIKKVIHGKDDVIGKVLCAILAGGHVLLEDIPGVGKTTLAVAFSRALSLDYRRMQLTPDVMPSDIVGFKLYDRNTGEFRFEEGSIYTNLFLADEINRTSPKTQSALLEVMEEYQATVEGQTRSLPEPFFVIATENPYGSAGTQRLPESQLDRFLVSLSMGYPDRENAIAVLKGDSVRDLREVKAVLDKDEIIRMQEEVKKLHTDESIYEYVVSITEATRNTEIFSLGLSPRGSIALMKMAKARGYLSGRGYVIPEDVRAVVHDVLRHRIGLSYEAEASNVTSEEIVSQIINNVEVP